MHAKVYTNVARQLSSSPSNLENPEETAVLLTTFGRILFKSSGEITWAKVISLFSVTAGLSIDLVRQNHEEHIPTLIEGFLGVIEDELMPFLSESNGWISLHNKLLTKKKKLRYHKYLYC
jgi:Bcl-2-related ovarian killer protein